VSDGSGNATIDIFPRLRESPANNTALDLTSPKGLFRLSENGYSIKLNVDKTFDVSFSAIEAV
jgi:hypothetical protein